MVNAALFPSKSSTPPAYNSMNEAGGKAYTSSPEEVLATFAMTCMFGDQFYTSAKSQLDAIIAASSQVSDEYLAQLAIYSYECGKMKDAPAIFTALLLARKADERLIMSCLNRAIVDGKRFRNLIQILQSKVFGNTNITGRIKRILRTWFHDKSAHFIFNSAIGNNPSMRDVLRLVHPKPKDSSIDATYSYIINPESEKTKSKFEYLPAFIKEYDEWLKDKTKNLPSVNFMLLTAHQLTTEQWSELALNMTLNQILQNINTLARHNVFENEKVVKHVVEVLKDYDNNQVAQLLPYKVYAAYKFTSDNTKVPQAILIALQELLEFTFNNVPALPDNSCVLVDLSGSMGAPVGGWRGSTSSKIECKNIASLMACALLRKNPNIRIFTFTTKTMEARLNSKDSLFTNTTILENSISGGTDFAQALQFMHNNFPTVENIIILSDMQAWAEYQSYGAVAYANKVWHNIVSKNNNAKIVSINLAASDTTQLSNKHKNSLNIGGFSDEVFNTINSFIHNKWNEKYWVNEIKKININKMSNSKELATGC